MLYHPEKNDSPRPEIKVNDILKRQDRSIFVNERQITVTRYRTYLQFDFNQVERAVQKCTIKATDDFGVITVKTSKDLVTTDTPTSNLEYNQSSLGDEWVRALFATIGDKSFQWLDFETLNIYEYLIGGVLNETFLIDYYQDKQNQLRFLTYGGSRAAERIQLKHQMGFGMYFAAIQEDFNYDFIRQICSKPDFIRNLKKIVYAPEGEDGYGAVDEALIRTKYENKIDPTAKRVKEILDNPKMLIREFEAKLIMSSPITLNKLNIRFNISMNGHITFYLPKIEFSRPKTDIDRENAIYEIVRSAYELVTKTDQSYDLGQVMPSGQMGMFEFLKDVE